MSVVESTHTLALRVIPSTTTARCECGRKATWWIEKNYDPRPVATCTIHTALLLSGFVAEHNIR